MNFETASPKKNIPANQKFSFSPAIHFQEFVIHVYHPEITDPASTYYTKLKRNEFNSAA